MKRRHGFIPSAANELEDRLVLSHVPAFNSVIVSGLYPNQQVLTRGQRTMIGEVNQAFNSFQNDFDQARATYYAAIQSPSTPSSTASTAATAFQQYTTQRVSLLAQQIINAFLQTPQGTARAEGAPNTLKQLVSLKVINPAGTGPAGSLISSLNSTIPQPGASAPTQTLFSQSQDNAIQSARVAVLNGVTILRNQAFGNPQMQHY